MSPEVGQGNDYLVDAEGRPSSVTCEEESDYGLDHYIRVAEYIARMAMEEEADEEEDEIYGNEIKGAARRQALAENGILRPQRVAILLVGAGGGHDAAARYIEEAGEHYYKGALSFETIDITKIREKGLVRGFGDLYKFLQGPGAGIWKAAWRWSNHPRRRDFVLGAMAPFFRDALLEEYSRVRPDIVVSVNPFTNHFTFFYLDDNIPRLTMVTDRDATHLNWVAHPGTVDYVMTATERSRQIIVGSGIQPEIVEVVGQPVGSAFTRRGVSKEERSPGLYWTEKEIAKRELGLDPDKPCVMVMGGGDGIGPIEEIVDEIRTRNPDVQVIVVCGRNKKLRKKLVAKYSKMDLMNKNITISDSEPPEQSTLITGAPSILLPRGTRAIPRFSPILIEGFTRRVAKLMRASDILVTKAGPGSLAEAGKVGVGLLVFRATPGQETANVEEMVRNCAGVYETEPAAIARVIKQWTSPGNQQLAQVIAKGYELYDVDSLFKIVTRIMAVRMRGRRRSRR